MKEPVFLDGPVVVVSREWFDRVRSEYTTDRSGCPFCASTREPMVDRREGIRPRSGCLDCDRWWSPLELSK